LKTNKQSTPARQCCGLNVKKTHVFTVRDSNHSNCSFANNNNKNNEQAFISAVERHPSNPTVTSDRRLTFQLLLKTKVQRWYVKMRGVVKEGGQPQDYAGFGCVRDRVARFR